MNSLCQFLYNPLLLERACAIALLVWLMITTLLIKFFRPRLDKDSETGLPTYTGLVKKHALFENRNLLALVHISNHASITNTLGREYAGALMRSAAQTLSALLPPGTLICRERTDKLLVVLPAMQDISCITLTLKKLNLYFSISVIGNVPARMDIYSAAMQVWFMKILRPRLSAILFRMLALRYITLVPTEMR